MKAGQQADKFGKFIVTKLRDEAIDFFDGLAAGHWKSAQTQLLQTELAGLTPKQREIARRSVVAAIDAGLHSFLFALSEAHNVGESVAVTTDGRNVAEQSDGLHGELYGKDGWLARYSSHSEGGQ